MAAKPYPWVDGPFPLIKTAHWPTRDSKEHAAVHMALEMARVHNMFLRGLNAIYIQAPQVKASNTTDVKDFMFFCKALVEMIEHHHSAEEEHLFPDISVLTGDPALMGANLEQHKAFHHGLDAFEVYLKDTEKRPETYKWEDLKRSMDGFVPPLMQHLTEEIETLLALRQYDSDALRKIWQKTEDIAKAQSSLRMMEVIMPCGLGCLDRTFEDGFHKDFPPFPFFIPIVIKYWFSRKYQGAWRFTPSTLDGYPRPLEFGPPAAPSASQ